MHHNQPAGQFLVRRPEFLDPLPRLNDLSRYVKDIVSALQELHRYVAIEFHLLLGHQRGLREYGKGSWDAPRPPRRRHVLSLDGPAAPDAFDDLGEGSVYRLLMRCCSRLHSRYLTHVKPPPKPHL